MDNCGEWIFDRKNNLYYCSKCGQIVLSFLHVVRDFNGVVLIDSEMPRRCGLCENKMRC